MSRYRPPRERSSPYITPEGHQRLSAELKHLWKVERPEVTRKVSEAAAMGDRSENAEYIYGKKQLRQIDGRIAFLSRRLDQLTIVDRLPPRLDRVYFGAWVVVLDTAGARKRFRLVGADEFDRQPDYISVDSPMARALLGKQAGDAIELARPPRAATSVAARTRTDDDDEPLEYQIERIDYPGPVDDAIDC